MPSKSCENPISWGILSRMLALEVNTRDSKESTDMLRERGFLPAVFYGPKEESTPIAIDGRKMLSVWKQAGETTIVRLTGAGTEKECLIRDVQFHPVSSEILHVDFYALEKGKKIEIQVPLVFTGVSPAEKAGHIIVKALHEIEIEVEPAELPHNLSVDMTVLVEVGNHITADQIVLPPSAHLITDADEIVASVAAFVEEKEEVPEVPAEGAAPVEGAADAAAPAPEEESR